MSTRSRIGYQDPETGQIVSSYVHMDGYPTGVGRDLVKNFGNWEAFKGVVDMGDQRTLGEPFTQSAFADERLGTQVSETLEEFLQLTMDNSGEYAYLAKPFPMGGDSEFFIDFEAYDTSDEENGPYEIAIGSELDEYDNPHGWVGVSSGDESAENE